MLKLGTYRVKCLAACAVAGMLLISSCTPDDDTGRQSDQEGKFSQIQTVDPENLSLPLLQPAGMELDDKLNVVVTTSIIGDVVSHVGGEAVELTVLMKPGQDPHSYLPTARDLSAVVLADVVLVNGWGLEAGLLEELQDVAGNGPIVPVSANLRPLRRSGEIDPHVWLNPSNVLVWVENIGDIFAALDPGRAAEFRENGNEYRNELNALVAYAEEKLGAIPETNRALVTNHDALGHLAAAYGFEIIGAVIPAMDSLAEPSARDLARLVEKLREAQLCVIYAEYTASDRVARAAAAELENCASVEIIPLHTGALGPAGGPTASYIGMMRQNVDAIASGQTGHST